jgi:hypothetical protein
MLFNMEYDKAAPKATELRVLGDLMAVMGKAFAAAALLPQDTLLIRCVGALGIFSHVYMLTGHHLRELLFAIRCRTHATNWHHCTDDLALHSCSIFLDALVMVSFLRMYCMPARKALDTYWRLQGCTMFIWAVEDVIRLLSRSMPIWNDGEGFGEDSTMPIWEPSLYVLVDLLFGSFFLYPRTREYVQAALNRRGPEVNVASLIAGFLGGSSDEDGVRKDSKRFFRYVLLSDLTLEDMVAATAGTRSQDVFRRSQPALLGEIDAFVSHSWHDDPRAKWEALQTWCKDFCQMHGREPKLWLDFCCIDQSNIEANLRCLPVYLSGCRALLIVAGPTYVRRLWCAIELFVFVSIHVTEEDHADKSHRYIHGPTEDHADVPLEVRVLGQTEEQCSSVREGLANFDIMACQCFDPKDKFRLLDVVEAGCGTKDVFNMQVRGMMGSFQKTV